MTVLRSLGRTGGHDQHQHPGAAVQQRQPDPGNHAGETILKAKSGDSINSGLQNAGRCCI